MQRKEDKNNLQNPLDRSEEIQRQIQALSSRDWQLWSIGILVILVLSAGFLAVMFPNMSLRRDVELDGRMLPQFFFGLVTLIVLFNVCVISQKRTVNATRHELIRELVFSERMESLSMLDPATQLLNHRGIEQALTHEVARANRLGTDLTLMVMKLETLSVVNARYGTQAGDKFTVEAAKLLRSTFRGSDVVARNSGDEFLAILPNTSEQQAEYAQKRVQEAIDTWNLSTKTGWEISLVYGTASHVVGGEVGDLLRTAQRKAVRKRERVVPMVVSARSVAGKPGQLMI
jgi:diguanylate cyclase (GGDEF)-like protein